MQYNTTIVPLELSPLLTDTDIQKPTRNQYKGIRSKDKRGRKFIEK